MTLGCGMETTECKWSYAGDNQHREFVLPGPFKKDGVSGKKICLDCCKFLGWVWTTPFVAKAEEGKPAGTYAKRDLVYLLQKKLGEMNEWERKFINDLHKRTVWSEKQQAAFEKIRTKFFDVNEKEEKDEPAQSEQPKQPQQSVTNLAELLEPNEFDVPF